MNKNNNATVLTIGTFDGVHLGHKYLLSNLVEFAKKYDKRSLLITYNRHPLETLHSNVFPYLLTEKEKKIELIKQIGIDEIVFLDFNQEFSNLEANSFLEDYIIKLYHPFAIFSGYDTHFGKNRNGNLDLLNRFSKKHDFQVIQAEPYTIQENLIISSSMIREFIRKGMIDTANSYLGYNYSLLGDVVTGKQIGRTLGFPTINISPIDKMKLIPDIGVYVTLCIIDQKSYYSVTNIGNSPTIKTNSGITIEAHLLDFKGDLYNKKVELIFLSKIRGEIKFNTKLELIKKIESDITYTRNYMNNYFKYTSKAGKND